MTAPDPIEAAIDAATKAAFDAMRAGMTISQGAKVGVRAAAPILIAAGREAAAKAVEDSQICNCTNSGCPVRWMTAPMAADIARGNQA